MTRKLRALALAAALPTMAVAPHPHAAAAPAASAPHVVIQAGAHEAIHVVQRGEHLSGIARRYGTTVAELASANGISNRNLVRIGTRLRVPTPTTTHVVQRGEHLSGIAVRYATTVPTLRRLNHIPNPNFIRIGSRLTVPASASSRPPAPVPASRAHLQPLFERYAAEAGVPADLAMALAWQESGWQAGVVSSAGATGVMQLMPATVDFTSQVLLRRRSPLDPTDPASNIQMGTRFLRYLLDETGGDTQMALAAYFQGLRSVQTRGPQDSSLRFAANVMALRSRF